MTPSRLVKNVLACSLLLTGLSAIADNKVIEVEDWSLWDASTASNPNGTCLISTKNTGLFRTEVYFLELVKLRNKVDSPVEVFIRVEKNKRGSTGFIADLPSSHLTFSQLGTTENRQNFWGIAKNLSSLVNQLNSEEDIQVHGVGGSKGVDFSFSSAGFKQALAEMEKRCNNGQSLINQDFENTFLSSVAQIVDPLSLAVDSTVTLRQIYFQAYSKLLQLSETQTALGQVLAKYQPAIDELRQVNAELSKIQNSTLPNTKQALAAAQKLQVDSQAEISRLTALIPSLESKVQASQKVYDSAYAILAPLEGEYNRLVSALNSAQSALSQAQSRLAFVDNRLATLAREISSLSSESEVLRRSIDQRRFDLNQAYVYLRDAERNRAAFNISFEQAQRLRSHGEYNNLMRERGTLEQASRKAEQGMRQAQNDKDRAAAALAQCKASANAPVAVVGGGTTEVGGDLPPEKQDPNVVGSIASADCSELERALQAASNRVTELERGVREIASRMDQINRRTSDIQRQIAFEVQHEYDMLVRREQDMRRQVESLEDALRNDQSRFAQILNVEIPYRQQEQGQLINERPSVINNIQQSSSQLNSLNQEFANFKATTDWDHKKEAVDHALTQLRADQSSLSSVRSQKAQAEANLEKGKNSEIQLKAQIKVLEDRVVALTQRAGELDKSIAPLASERAPLDIQIASLSEGLDEAKSQFLDILN